MVMVDSKELTPLMTAAQKATNENARSAMKAAMLAGDMVVVAYLQRKFFMSNDVVAAVG